MSQLSDSAIRRISAGNLAYCKFLSANDTGDTGGHQAGIYVAKNATRILFDTDGVKGENKDRWVKIRWQDDFETDSRFIYYGVGTRDEYRITRFGKGFPFLQGEHTGDLFILVKNTRDDYFGYVLGTEEEINDFLDTFGLSPADTGTLIGSRDVQPEDRLEAALSDYVQRLSVDFPSTFEMSTAARKIEETVFDHGNDTLLNPDRKLVAWIRTEYQLFKRIEHARYFDIIAKGFNTVDAFVETANSILNKRKSRAGKSLENHLAKIFDCNDMSYSAQPITEGHKRPDFIFPGEVAYHTPDYPQEGLVFLAAKTTCKDRWRQIINEAELIRNKHLITLQQGISVQQMSEMEAEGVILVVPEPYINTYPREKRAGIWTLKKFIDFTKERTVQIQRTVIG